MTPKPSSQPVWHFTVALIAVLAGVQLIAYFAQWPWLYWLIAWPGTVLHEAAHWLLAWALQGAPSQFHVWPDWAALADPSAHRAYALGSVHYTPNWYNSASVAMAPLLLWHVAAFGLWLYLAASSITSAWPSTVDWRHAWQSPTSWPLAALLCGGIAWGSWRGLRILWQRRTP